MQKIFLAYVLFLTAPSFAQTADDIVNKYLTATGGLEKWSKVVSVKYTGAYQMGPGMQAPVTVVYTSKPFAGSYSDFSWQGMTTREAIRADSGWNYNPFGGKRETDPLSPEDLRTDKLNSDPQGLMVNYKQKGYTIEYLGTDDMDGTDVFKLRLTTKTGDMVYYYIDAETYYLLKEVHRIKFAEKETKTYSTFSDFRKTDYGLIVPFCQQRLDENGNEQGGPVNYSKIEMNGTVDVSVFDKPKL